MAIVNIHARQNLILTQFPAPLEVVNDNDFGAVVRQMPFGEYFNRLSGWWRVTAGQLARFLSRFRYYYRQFVRNMNPATSTSLLDEWESAYGVEVPTGATIEERRVAVLTTVQAQGGNTAAYYESVAVSLGFLDAVVTDAADPFTTASTVDDVLQGGEYKVTFLVTATSVNAIADQQLVNIINSQLLAGWFALYDLT